MKLNFKEDVLYFLADILFVFWAIYKITKSETKSIFYFIFLLFFIVVLLYLKIIKEEKIPYKASEWEKVLYIIGILLFIFNLSFVKDIFLSKNSLTYYNDWNLIINTFFLSFGAFILFLRVKEIGGKIKKILK